jgi:hypothetical protein
MITLFVPSTHDVNSYYFLHSLGISSHTYFTLDTRGSTESLLLYYENIALAKRMTVHLINTCVPADRQTLRYESNQKEDIKEALLLSVRMRASCFECFIKMHN